MTNIHAFRPPMTAEGAERLLGDLRKAHTEGCALGSREPHIRALSSSLETILERLSSAFTTLLGDLGNHEICTDVVRRDFDSMSIGIERLLAKARALNDEKPRQHHPEPILPSDPHDAGSDFYWRKVVLD